EREMGPSAAPPAGRSRASRAPRAERGTRCARAPARAAAPAARPRRAQARQLLPRILRVPPLPRGSRRPLRRREVREGVGAHARDDGERAARRPRARTEAILAGVRDAVLWVGSATFVAGVLGVVWYSPFGFGDAWIAAVARQRAELRNPVRAMAASFVALVASALALGVALRLLGVTGVYAGAFCGLLAGAIVTAATFSDYL